MSSKKRRRIIAGAVSALVIFLYIWGFRLEKVNYNITSNKINDDVKIVFVSDLHDCVYGKNQSGLMEEIEIENPDIVLFGGDVIDSAGGSDDALEIMRLVKEKYPCAYSAGNHEVVRDDCEEFFEDVSEIGIPILYGQFCEMNVKGQKIRVYGIIDSYEKDKHEQLDECYDNFDDSYYNILLAHQPEQCVDLLDTDEDVPPFDLVLSGHAHGGQWRLPYILEQGLYAPDQGIFPERTTGVFECGNSVQIVSRGLARPLRMIFIPRIFNRPELSVITLSKGENK